MKILYVLVIIFICALIGTALNALVLQLLPQQSVIYNIMSVAINPLWSIEKLDLIVFTVNFGVSFNFTILTLLGIIAGCIYSLRKI